MIQGCVSGEGQQSSEGQWRASAHSNGDAKAEAQQPEQPLSARSFSRSRSSSFSKGLATGVWVPQDGEAVKTLQDLLPSPYATH